MEDLDIGQIMEYVLNVVQVLPEVAIYLDEGVDRPLTQSALIM